MRLPKLFLAAFAAALVAFAGAPIGFSADSSNGIDFAQVRDVDGDGEAELIEVDEDLDGDVDRI